MTDEIDLVTRLSERLQHDGYVIQTMPIRVANVLFSFSAALLGNGANSLDLVLVIDTTVASDMEREARQIEAIARALDVSGSKRVLTVILAGSPFQKRIIDRLARVCRILEVEAGTVPGQELDDAVRVLLKLDLEPCRLIHKRPLDEVRSRIPSNIDLSVVDTLLESTSGGAKQVSSRFAALIKEALS